MDPFAEFWSRPDALTSPAYVLASAAPVVCEPLAYELAIKHGVMGRADLARKPGQREWIDALQVEPCIFDEGRFVPACYCTDQGGAELAFLFAGRDEDDDPADCIAWAPESDRAGALLGNLGVLGLAELAFMFAPPMVHESLGDWLRAGRVGLFLLDDEKAAHDLRGFTVAARGAAAGVRLRHRLLAHTTTPPRIVIPKGGNARAA